MLSFRKRLKNKLEFILFLAAISFLRSIPYNRAESILIFLFDIIGYRIGIRKKVALIQLLKTMPELGQEKLHQILRDNYKMMALNAAEEYILPDKELIKKTSINGLYNVKEAFALNRGVLLGTAHFGNWEAARLFPLYDIPMSVITKRQRNYYFNDYTDAIRSAHGVSIIDMRKGLRDILEHLKNNEMVAILADQNAGKHGMIFDFMGYPASHWLGIAKLSLRYKIPIIPGFALRNKDKSTVFRFEKMIYHPELDDHQEHYETVLRELDQVLERYIRRYPEQWFWVHKRWKGAYDMFREAD